MEFGRKFKVQFAKAESSSGCSPLSLRRAAAAGLASASQSRRRTGAVTEQQTMGYCMYAAVPDANEDLFVS